MRMKSSTSFETTGQATSADIWHNMMESLGQDRYDELDQMGVWDQ